ncbi:substrate-binding periplasmic protein [Methyloprofundus sp.]|uniref:substrate-binding periplasmic protein n=1 Tax=Methyloprofundus sp. TaxID=2020875 RepID=UPI003D12BB5D
MIMRPALLLLLLNLFISTCAAQAISIVSSQWPPYVDDSLPEKGLAVELVNKALQRKGYQPTLHIYNWQRALEGVEIGVFDATCAIWKTAERERNLMYSKPYLTNTISFIKKKSTPVEYHGLADLQGLVIGVVRDYAYDENFNKSRRLIKIPANFSVQNLQKLNNGTIDLTLGDERAINYTLEKFLPTHVNAFEFVKPALTFKKLYLQTS